MKHVYLFLVVSFCLTGCESFMFDKTANDVQEKVKSQKFFEEQDSAIYVKSPSLYKEVKLDNLPSWMELPVTPIKATSGVPFAYLNTKVLSDNGINFIISDDIANPNLPVVVNVRGRIRDALDDISHVTGYSYTIVGNTVNWSSYVTETFNVTYIPGTYSYAVGSTLEQGSSGSGDAEQIQFGGNGQEYSSVKAKDTDAFTEISKVTKQIVGKYGSVAASTATSSVIVTTTKARMDLVRNYFAAVENKLGRQIAFDIKLLRFTSNIGGLAGVDWNLEKYNPNSSIVFNGGNFSSMLSGSPITISATQNGGQYDGSTALVSLLEKQGTVSIVNSPRMVTQPNRVVELELSELEGYIARTEVTPSTSISSSEPSVSLVQGIVESGYRLYALANIGDQNKIILHLSSTYIPKPVIERKEVLTSAIETPSMTRNRNVSTVVLRNGETMMISGLQIESASDESESPLSSRLLPTRKSKKSVTTETIALVTPIIVDMN